MSKCKAGTTSLKLYRLLQKLLKKQIKNVLREQKLQPRQKLTEKAPVITEAPNSSGGMYPIVHLQVAYYANVQYKVAYDLLHFLVALLTAFLHCILEKNIVHFSPALLTARYLADLDINPNYELPQRLNKTVYSL